MYHAALLQKPFEYAAASDVVLLGETHTDAIAHKLQEIIFARLAAHHREHQIADFCATGLAGEVANPVE